MSVINDYDNWRKHYLAMINGKILPNQKVYVVNDSSNQSGKGLQIISSAAQKDAMARALVENSIKPVSKRKSVQSRSQSQRKRSVSKTRPKISKKVIQKKKKITKRKR